MSFFEELKRRNVVRVGVAYGIASWVLLQVADLVLEAIEAPSWVLVVALGFVVALVVAWAYEMTPEGIKKESEVDRSQSIVGQTGKKLDRIIILFLVLAVSVLLVERSMTKPPSEPGATSSESSATDPAEPALAGQSPSEPSIAVLPFVNMSNDPEQEYFSDGIAEELLNLLVRVDGLQVASRTSSFIYKGENLNIPAIAGELKVDHILEGSVRKAGDRVRITAQLIDVSTDRHLWSDTFDRELDDIFAIQDEIANAIVDALKDELGVGLESVAVEKATDNLDAYELFLRGRGLFLARQDLTQANNLLEQATRLDPGFAQAWEVLAASHAVSDSWLTGDGIDHTPLAELAARRALELDPNLSMPYAVLGLKTGNRGEFVQAMEHLDTAIRNDEKNATAWLWRGIQLRNLGYHGRAIEDFKRCNIIDPQYLLCRAQQAAALLSSGNSDEAIAVHDRVLKANFHAVNDEFVAHYVHKGDRRTASLLAALTVIGEYAPISSLIEAIANPGRPNTEAEVRVLRFAESRGMDPCEMGAFIVAFRWEHCFTSHKIGTFTVIWHPDAAIYRQSQAFKNLAMETLLPYWREHGFPPQCRDLGDGDFECD